MKSSKNSRIHGDWKILGVVVRKGNNFFEYQCSKCGVKVFNGEPYTGSSLNCK